MVWVQRLWFKFRTLLLRQRIAQRLDDEIQFHLEQQIAENIAAGVSRDEAGHAARRLFGNAAWGKEGARVIGGWEVWAAILRALRDAARTPLERPGFAAAPHLSVALGIGARP